MRRYAWLLAAAVLIAAALGLVARRPRRPEATALRPPAVRAVVLDLRLEPGGLVPEVSSVPKDHMVLLTFTNRRRTPVRVSLQGYEQRVSTPAIAPDSSWRGAFVADRPGEDFAWMVEGEPAGRLIVLGSHLIEGHR